MARRISNGKIVEIDPMFDGHLEKRVKDMTPKEKLDWLWMQMVFKFQAKQVEFLPKRDKDKSANI